MDNVLAKNDQYIFYNVAGCQVKSKERMETCGEESSVLNL